MSDTHDPMKQEVEDEDPDDYIVIPDFMFEGTAAKSADPQELSSLAKELKGHLRPIAEALSHNLHSVYRLVSLPLRLVFQGNTEKFYWFKVATELIKRRRVGIKKSEFEALLVSIRTGGHEKVDTDIAATFIRENLADISKDPEFVSASRELLNQGLVLAWSSIEVLVSDLFCATLNAVPQAASRLLADQAVKKYLAIEKVSLDLLMEFGFNLSGSMGTILTRDLNFSSAAKMKVILTALFNSEAVRASLGSRALYLLNERRHLIVHRCGVVDAKYVRTARDRRVEGDRFQADSLELEEALAQVAKCGIQLLRAADKIER